MEEKNVEAYQVEVIDDNKPKAVAKQPGRVLALLSMIFAFVSLAIALLNILFGFITVALTLLLEIMPFLHAIFYLPVLIPSILAIVFACIARNKGNRGVNAKLGLIFGIISTAILVLSILGMTVLGVIAVVLAVVVGLILGAISAAVSGVLGFLVTLSPALAPILAIIGTVLAAVAPVLVKSFADAAAPQIIDMIMEFIRSL